MSDGRFLLRKEINPWLGINQQENSFRSQKNQLPMPNPLKLNLQKWLSLRSPKMKSIQKQWTRVISLSQLPPWLTLRFQKQRKPLKKKQHALRRKKQSILPLMQQLPKLQTLPQTKMIMLLKVKVLPSPSRMIIGMLKRKKDTWVNGWRWHCFPYCS